MSEGWFYSRGDAQEGPVTLEQLQELLRTGAIQPDNLVWIEGLTKWTAAWSIPALATAAAAPVDAGSGAPVLPIGVLGYQSTMLAEPPYAGFWLRFCATIIDLIITFPVTLAVSFIIGLIAAGTYGIRPGTADWILVKRLIQIAAVAISWLYYAAMESSNKQATLGKMVLGLKVTSLDGEPIGFIEATGRYFGKILSGIFFGIGYMMAGWTEKKQTLHDMIASALVVRK
ncbi:MAG TPA: RDD family protein [Tepidisphaeraceae bacterium]|nr:RDD family protein [Tepidisphaeraceae bacterium]